MNPKNRIKKKTSWYKVAELESLATDRVMTVTAGILQVCLVNHKDKLTALDNHCPHQGGPLGEGQIENGWVICPWHASDLMALAIKHAIVEHGPTALILPDEIQQLPANDPLPEARKEGRIASTTIAPPVSELKQAIDLINKAKRPAIIVGNGARDFSEEIIKFAENIQLLLNIKCLSL
jgi:uncharacterized Zn finger protein (UPF0148 family)